MKYHSFYKKEVNALKDSIARETYDEAAGTSLEYFKRFMSAENEKKIRLTPDIITDWINLDLIKRAALEVFKDGKYQTVSDILVASVIAFNVSNFLNDPEPPKYMPDNLFRAFCLSYALGYQKGERLFFEKLQEYGFKEGSTVWSPDLVHPDYMAFGLNLLASYQQGQLVIVRPGSRYDQLFDGQRGDENTINHLCQLHFLLAKGEKGSYDLECPFGYLADTVMPYEILAYRKLYEQCYGELLPVEGDAVCLMEPWLEPKFENRLEDKTCVGMVSALSQKLGKDFLAEVLD